MAISQVEPTLKPYDTYLPPLNLHRVQVAPLKNLDEVHNWMQLHRPAATDDRECGNLEFLCTLNTPSPERMRYLLDLCKDKKTAHLRRTLLETQNLLRIPLSFWEGASHQTNRGGWWVRALSEELTSKCGKCKRIWPAHQLAKDGCTSCKASTRQRQASPKKKKGAKTKFQHTLGLVMRSALPEEIKKICHHNLISDSALTLPHIQLCLEDMMQEMAISAADAPTSGITPAPIRLWFTVPELGHPLIDDNHDRPLHPRVGLFLREYLSRHEDMDDEDDEMGHFYTGLCDIRVLAHTMLENWETEPAVYDNDKGETTPNRHLRRNRERFSTPHTARDPNKIQEVELESEDLQGMIRQLPKVGAIWFHHEPESTNTSHADITATTFQGTTSAITSRRPYQLEGARWHLLTKVFSNPESFKSDFRSKLLL